MTLFEQMDLGDIVTFQRGFDITKAEQVPGAIPIISSSGITSFHNESKVTAPGIIIGRKGTLGTVHYTNDNYWPHDTTLWVKDFKGNFPKFIYYFLKTLHLENFDTGSSNPTLNRNHIHKIRVYFPKSIEIQRKIAAMLAAYDELIEVNRQRISLLEQAAEELYREWFVRMRFPGYEHTPIEHGIPQGWEIVKVEQAFDYTAGGTPSKNIERFWKNGTINWYTPSDITASQGIFLFESNDKCTEEGLDSSSSKIFPAYSIMMTSRATIGAIGINTTEACTNQGFITCIPNKTYPLSFLYHWLKTNKTYFESLCGGATFLELTKGVFKNINILTPPIEIMEIFERKTRPLIDSIENCQKQNQKLQTARDQLLPKLMAGTLDLSDLDIHYPPSMS
ncbi:restriction endonuclease subunit S [Herpetosiphon sp. NSE202]|uniref:restriction endonuclease subunit S n=1 Tax=Herpetosiphon sp. NSE202 TaxID=3351349 RepID=UPI003639349A